MTAAPQPLTPERLDRAAHELAARDPDLARIVRRIGPPPMWGRRPGYATLVRIILEQQVSLDSAAAAYRRLQDIVGRVTPARVDAAGESRLRAGGLTRQKAAYCVGAARAILDGRLDLGRLGTLPDQAVHEALLPLNGIGPWTVQVYLLMALRRPDIWPRGDLALAKALAEVKRYAATPDDATMAVTAAGWAPWRSVAARLLWHHYLQREP